MENLNKPLVKLSNTPLIEWSLQRIQHAVSQVVLSVNHNQDDYRYLNLPLIADAENNYQGPLIGIHSAMRWILEDQATKLPDALLCVPGDVPFFPEKLIPQLWQEFVTNHCEVVYCECDNQVQPLFSIWSLSCVDLIEEAIGDGLYGPKLVMPRLNSQLIKVQRDSDLDFFNINDEESLETVQKMINS